MTDQAGVQRALQSAPQSDADLLAAFAAGDRGAALVLTQRLTPRVMGQAYRMLCNRAEAAAVAQTALMRLWEMAADWYLARAAVPPVT